LKIFFFNIMPDKTRIRVKIFVFRILSFTDTPLGWVVRLVLYHMYGRSLLMITVTSFVSAVTACDSCDSFVSSIYIEAVMTLLLFAIG